jgi:hypothetical protein
MTTKVQYSQNVIVRSHHNSSEAIIINKPKSTKQKYSTIKSNIENPECSNFGFINDASYDVVTDSIAMNFNSAIFNDGLIHNISGGLYASAENLLTPPPSWGLNRFGSGSFLGVDVYSDNLNVVMFSRHNKQISVYRKYDKFEYAANQDNFYDVHEGILYVSESTPLAYGGEIWPSSYYDTIYSSLLPNIHWALLNNFQYVPKENDNTTVSLYSKYFPIYRNGIIAAKIGMGYVRIPNASVTVDTLTGIIIVDTLTSGYDIENIDGFYIVFGAIPCIISDAVAISKNLLDVDMISYATYLTIDNTIYTDAIVGSAKSLLMKKGTAVTQSPISIYANNKDTYIELNEDISFSNSAQSIIYVRSELDKTVNVQPNMNTGTLRPFSTGNAASGLISVQLEPHWAEELTDADWQTIMGTDTSGVALFGKFGDRYILMSSDQYKGVTAPSASTTHSYNMVPETDGYTSILNAWYDPSTLVLTSGVVALVEGTDYSLVYPNTIIFNDSSLFKDEDILIEYDVAVEPFIYNTNINTVTKTVAYNQYKDIWSIYDSQLTGLYYMAAHNADIFIGKVNTDGSRTVISSQTINAKINTTANYIKQLFTGLEGQY